MRPKHILIAGTVAFAITIGAGFWNEESTAEVQIMIPDNPAAFDKTQTVATQTAAVPVQDELHQALGVTSDEEIYDALYNGQSLAEVAASRSRDVRDVIALQTAQLSAQLDDRLAGGSLSREAYEAHKAELVEVITRSVTNAT
ncbi:hypothetical protein [Paenibacillus chitinolyticus]|uniref:hypothetical protein n=1 Tax=Paenibacillus chitinolyticus TaxID=79263 RepID=UPI003CFFA0D3